jgi:solute carrier family 25 aspartate/glutamate transporter 12/13
MEGTILYMMQTMIGLYRGLGANLIGVTPEKAIKLAVNEILRENIVSDESKIELWQEMVCGGMAGFVQVSITNPMVINLISVDRSII